MSSRFASVRSAVTGVTVVVGLAVSSRAIAQAPVPSFEQLPTQLRVGDTIYITDAAGVEHRGKIAELSPTSLSLLVDAKRRDFPKENVSAVRWREPDPLVNGAQIGGLVGLGFGVLATVMGCREEGCTVDEAVGVPLVVAAFGVGVGALVDALTPGKKVLVYRAPSASPAARISVSPLLSRSGQGLAVSVRF